MIVSVTIADNRESEISDAIRSVIDQVDRVLLVDTGITDNTVTRAREVAHGKLRIVKHTWRDFSSARNASLDAARKLGATWILIVDSDERINFGDVDLREALKRMRSDVIFLDSIDGHYPKEKIIRASAPAFFSGPTHEALNAGVRETLRGVTHSELPKSWEQLQRKFTRDVVLLTEHVKKNPDDPRWWYYLGASHEGLGDRERAADAFGECVRRRKTGVEAAWAAFKQAEQLCALDRFEEVISAAARGIEADATFAECAWLAGFAAFRLGRTDQAVAWARISESVGRYNGCGTDRAWFKHLPALYELPYDVLRFALPEGPARAKADADFHAAKLVRVGVTGDRDLEQLSVTRSAPQPSRDEARSMLRPPVIASICPSARSSQIKLDVPEGFYPMNPSICLHKEKIWCVVRTVNYKITGRSYAVNDPKNVVQTENYLGTLSLDGTLEAPHLMRDLDESPRQESQIIGYEDVRLVSIDGDHGPVLSGSATVCDRDAHRRLIARLHLNADGDVERAVVQVTQQWHEKNWMPLSIEGKLVWIYSIDPTSILPGPLRTSPLALDHLRGGAAIAFKDGYLCVMHEVVEADESRIYLHRFVRLDARFNVTAVSASWIFARYGIEFCAGMVLDGDDLVLSYGIADQEAWITRISVKEVEAMRWISP